MNEVFRKRHSTRSFKEKEIEPEKLEEILEAANSAPSAGDLKAREILVVKDKKTKESLVKATIGEQKFVAEAAVVLVFFAVPLRSAARYKERGKDLYCLQDATISASFAWLQAVMLGLSCCWVGAFEENQVKDILKIKEDWRPIALLPIGYSAEEVNSGN